MRTYQWILMGVGLALALAPVQAQSADPGEYFSLLLKGTVDLLKQALKLDVSPSPSEIYASDLPTR